MKITAIDPRQTRNTAGQLKGGDIFVRDADRVRPLSSRSTYLVLWKHSRLDDLKKYSSTSKEVVCVLMSNGKLTSVNASQPILELEAGDLELPIKPNDDS